MPPLLNVALTFCEVSFKFMKNPAADEKSGGPKNIFLFFGPLLFHSLSVMEKYF